MACLCSDTSLLLEHRVEQDFGDAGTVPGEEDRRPFLHSQPRFPNAVHMRPRNLIPTRSPVSGSAPYRHEVWGACRGTVPISTMGSATRVSVLLAASPGESGSRSGSSSY